MIGSGEEYGYIERTPIQESDKLNPGNKLYATMYLITANRLNIKIKDKEYIETNIKSENGLYTIESIAPYERIYFYNNTYNV